MTGRKGKMSQFCRVRRRLLFPYDNCSSNGPHLHKGSGRYCLFIHSPDGSKVYTQYSRYLVSVKLGRLLLDSESVDHIDEDKTNDSIDNLTVLSMSENSIKGLRYNFPDGQSRVQLVCPECKSYFSIRKANSFVERGKLYNACSRKCNGLINRRLQLLGLAEKDAYLDSVAMQQISTLKQFGGKSENSVNHKHILPSFDEYSKPVNDAMPFAKHITKARIEKANPRLCPVCKENMVGLPKTRITCSDECSRKRLKLADIPLLEELITKLAELKSFVQVAKYYGVSDNAVRKWLRKYGRDDLTRKT